MSSFRDLQQIYTEGWRGSSYNPPPNAKYVAAQGKHSYNKDDMPFNAGTSSNNYARSAATNNNFPVAIDEEEPIDKTRSIPITKVCDKIDKLIEGASEDGMEYAIHTLATLKAYIHSL
jgi:hypothetical protein